MPRSKHSAVDGALESTLVRRVRRPLLALIALILALIIGYVVRAVTDSDSGAPTSPQPSVVHSMTATFGATTFR
jgi:hypothetical protein